MTQRTLRRIALAAVLGWLACAVLVGALLLSPKGQLP